MTAIAEHDTVAVPESPSARPVIGRVVQVVVVVALVAAIVFGTLWLVALNSGNGRLAAERDAALSAAQQSAVNLNTLDFHDPEGGLALWMASATGPVLDEFRKNRDQYAKIVAESKRTTTAQATDAAVSELDDRAGIARVLVGVDVTVSPDGQQQVVTRQRLQMEMTRMPDGTWKVSRLNPVRNPGSAAPN